MGCGAILSLLKLIVSLPDGLGVPGVGMPYLSSVKPAAVSAGDSAGEAVDGACILSCLLSSFKLFLDQFEGFRLDDGFVAVLHVVLGHFAFVEFLFFVKKLTV
jgi:hypothetical protein